MRDNRITGEKGVICDLCGFEYRESEIVTDMQGRNVCTVIPCLANEDNQINHNAGYIEQIYPAA